MKIKPLVLAASLVALLPNAQIGTAVAVTGLTVALTAPAEAKKTREERLAAKRARQLARALAKAKRHDEKVADKIEFSDHSHEGSAEPMDNGTPPFIPGSEPNPN